MKVHRSTILPRRLVAALLSAGALTAALAAVQDIKVTRHTKPAQEVLVRSFAPYDANCLPVGAARIEVTAPPAHGELAQRNEIVTIGANWVGSTHCQGTKLDGVSLYYKPREGFEGTDRFVIRADYPQRLGRVNAVVEVVVSAQGAR
jgi:hypothetical protein